MAALPNFPNITSIIHCSVICFGTIYNLGMLLCFPFIVLFCGNLYFILAKASICQCLKYLCLYLITGIFKADSIYFSELHRFYIYLVCLFLSLPIVLHHLTKHDSQQHTIKKAHTMNNVFLKNSTMKFHINIIIKSLGKSLRCDKECSYFIKSPIP